MISTVICLFIYKVYIYLGKLIYEMIYGTSVIKNIFFN